MEEKNSFIVISVDYVTGPSLNPKKVWRGDMQLVKTSIGTFIDTLPFKKYGKELPGYDWRQPTRPAAHQNLCSLMGHS